MEERDRQDKEKHATKAVTSEPQEEFIEPEAQPSKAEDDQKSSAPPRERP